MEPADALRREHRQLRAVLERHVREGEAPPAHPHRGDVHADRPLPEHAVLRVAGGAQPARRGRHHAAHPRADEAVR